jgi:hypothetical protein
VPLVWRGLRRVHDLPVLGVAGFVPGLKPRPAGRRLIGDCGPPPLAQKQQRAKDGPPTHSLFTSTFAAMWTVFWAARKQIKANILKIKDLGRNKIPIVLQVQQSKWKQDVRAKAAS